MTKHNKAAGAVLDGESVKVRGEALLREKDKEGKSPAYTQLLEIGKSEPFLAKTVLEVFEEKGFDFDLETLKAEVFERMRELKSKK